MRKGQKMKVSGNFPETFPASKISGKFPKTFRKVSGNFPEIFITSSDTLLPQINSSDVIDY